MTCLDEKKRGRIPETRALPFSKAEPPRWLLDPHDETDRNWAEPLFAERLGTKRSK